MSEEIWTVIHTRPRREKVLSKHCTALSLPFRLPLIPSVRRYQRRTVTFEKPLFPGYIFLPVSMEVTRPLLATGHIARLCPVPGQQAVEFSEQLAAIERALEAEDASEIQLAPEIRPGIAVRIRHGSLRGSEAWVQERRGRTEVVLRLDFIGQGAILRMDADSLEPV